ncbi:AfsR/SARP family transcriptional regulator [Streptomyces platensis]|uniref:AfsR/SARP family transcriptional regulator n=1 Tax=Streptomyces platensis TaxID=58346 RepID=UPI0033342FC3
MPARKVRQILSLLLLHESHYVSIASLTYELWASEPPKSAITTVQTYIVQLRKLLAQVTGTSTATVSKEVLQTSGTSYRLHLPTGSIDLHEYRRLLAAADGAHSCGREHEAVALWQQAERLWSGDALSDIEHGPLLQAEAASLQQSRTSVWDRRIEAQLCLGMHHHILGELAGMVHLRPFDERLHANFMLALYRSGNRGRALQVFQDLRRSMVEELGVEPSPRVQRLLQQILSNDEALELAPCTSLQSA